MEQERRLVMTEEEFLRIPESHDHIELIDGEVFMAPSPTYDHQHIAYRIMRAFDDWAASHPPATAAISPLDVRVAPGRILQPDVMLWIGGLQSHAMPIATIPDLVVEVLSGDPRYDRLAKKLLYSEAGVREYWILDPHHRTIELAHGLDTAAPVSVAVASSIATGLVLDPAAIFPAR
jgi:Uma2 family endonuclease